MQNQHLPYFIPDVHHTSGGIAYLQQPGVVVVATPFVDMTGLQGFLRGFNRDLLFEQYLEDTHPLSPTEILCMFGGQLCYFSFGPKRTRRADARKYFANIRSSGHGSLFEHGFVSILGYGIDRSVTHEIVRHRAGFGFSQVSQRYTGPGTLRYVERLAYQNDTELHERFLLHVDRNALEYEETAAILLKRQAGGDAILAGDNYTERRKRVNQTARSVLSNDVEAPILITANIRAWRHFIEMRANEHADIQARLFAYTVYQCLVQVAPILFEDYRTLELSDGTKAVETDTRKV